MNDDGAESTSRALERYIIEQLGSLSLDVPVDDVELMARFVEEEGLEREDKVEGVRGMLEGVVEGGLLPDAGVDEVLHRVLDEWDRLHEEEMAHVAETRERTLTPPPDHRAVLESLTDEELAAARRAALLRQYAYVEGGPEADNLLRPAGAPPRANSAADAEEKRKAEQRRLMIEEALRLDGKKKKHRKKQTIDDPLEWQNLNKDKVQAQQQMAREAARKGAQEKKDRDRAALEKQRMDAARAKADKQKKAAKQERRA